MARALEQLPLVTPCALRLPLSPAPDSIVAELNRAIAAGAVRDATGAVVRQPLEGLLVAADGRGFAVRGGIAQLFPAAWIRVDSQDALTSAQA